MIPALKYRRNICLDFIRTHYQVHQEIFIPSCNVGVNCLNGEVTVFEATQPRTGPARTITWNPKMLEDADPQTKKFIEEEERKCAATAVDPEMEEIELEAEVVSELQELLAMQKSLQQKQAQLNETVEKLF